MKKQITVSQHDAVELLNGIEDGWWFVGGKFYNDYATLELNIEGELTGHKLVLRRDGSWSFKAEVAL